VPIEKRPDHPHARSARPAHSPPRRHEHCIPQALPGTALDYFDAACRRRCHLPGAYDKLPYTSRVLAENLVRRCDPATLTDR
jgi:hypothetical protein